MQADFRKLGAAPTSGQSTPASHYFNQSEVEVALATTIAAAAGAASSLASGADAVTTVSATVLFPSLKTFASQASATAVATTDEWTRSSRDDCARCIDRAVTRVYPSVDPSQFLSATSPVFCTVAGPTGGAWSSVLSVTLEFCTAPTHKTHFAERSYAVDGVAVDVSRLPSFIQRTVPTGGGGGAAPADGVADERPEGDRNADDEDLWRRARASRTELAYLDVLASSPLVSAEEARVEQQRQVRLVRRLARHAVERVVNEASWAVPLLTSASLLPLYGGARKGKPVGGGSHAPAYLPLFASTSPPIRHKTVLEAASAEARRAHGAAAGEDTKTARHGVAHADVRGMEFTGVIAGLTARYAYVACESTGGKAAPTLVLVARVPVPAWLASAHVAATPPAGQRKRGRDGATTAAAAVMASRYENFADATLYDKAADFTELPADERPVVDIRAHRLLCKTSPTTQRVTLWFEDTHIVGHTTAAEAEAKATEVSSFTELMELVGTSCERYLAERLKLQDMWRSLQAEEREEREERAEAKRRAVQARQDAAAAAAQDPREDEEADDNVSAQSVDSIGATASDDAGVLPAKASPLMPLEDDEAKWNRLRREQNLRLLSSADTLLKALTDPSAILFGKTRIGQDKGRSATTATTAAADPFEIRSCRDIQQLEEGPMVEFKYGLGTKGGAIMDAQRLRNTMAGMASTLGGVICIGVSDSGETVGQTQGEVRAALRVSGFCPAFANNAVSVRDVRVLGGGGATDPADKISGDDDAKPKMPKDWWKAAPAPSVAAPAAGSSKQPHARSGAPGGDRVVTVVTVAKGAGPFYASGRSALPYARGCASTTPMTVCVMYDRLLRELAATAMS